MGSTNKKRLVLLGGTSVLALQLVAAPIGFDGERGEPTLRVAWAEQSCFTAGTMILMADGTERPIRSVRPGDLVLGRRGRVNRVLGCERTKLGRRRLHALNGGRPFVTAEHPFLTTEGWKALDPEATRRENGGLAVAALQLGGHLCRATARPTGGERRSMPAAPGVLFVQGTAVLEALASVDEDPGTILFNLLLDGDHTYVADGWIVHNKEAAPEGGGGGEAAGGGDTSDADPEAGAADSSASDGSAGEGARDGSGSEGDVGESRGDGDSSGADNASSANKASGSESPSGGESPGGGDAAGGAAGGGSPAGDGPAADGGDPGSEGSLGESRASGAEGGDASAAHGDQASSAARGGGPERGAAAAAGLATPATRAGKGATARSAQTRASTATAKGLVDRMLDSLGIEDPAEAGLEPTGPTLNREQERGLIDRGWRVRD